MYVCVRIYKWELVVSGKYWISVAKMKLNSCFYAESSDYEYECVIIGHGHWGLGDGSYILITDCIWDFWKWLSSMWL